MQLYVLHLHYEQDFSVFVLTTPKQSIFINLGKFIKNETESLLKF